MFFEVSITKFRKGGSEPSFLTNLSNHSVNTPSVVHGALLHPDPEVVLGRGYAIPPFIQRMGSPSPAIQDIHLPRKIRVINSISQFDDPEGWKPVKEKYDEKDFEDGFKKDDKPVTGPPYGKHFTH